MFGYVAADRSTLTESQLLRYRGCYCGLCKEIGRNYGFVHRLSLNYDLTFLSMLLSSLYEPEETSTGQHCFIHPFRSCPSWRTECTAYAAAINMILVYQNCLDDWHDDRKMRARVQAAVFHGAAEQAAKKYPRQWQATVRCMETLSALEVSNSQNPDAGANAFGLLMAELFVWQEDRWSPQLRQMGASLGRFIYLLDAIVDLPQDLKHGSYNPLRSRSQNQDRRSSWLPILTQYMGECTEAFEQLPLLQDLDILRNILYSGVWSRFTDQTREEPSHV